MKTNGNFHDSLRDKFVVSENETAYLLSNPANKIRLLAAIARVENNQLIDVDIEKLSCSNKKENPYAIMWL
jgi:hypothetical protein